MRRRTRWKPVIGKMAFYNGKYSTLSRAGMMVIVVAEARNGRMCVKAIGKQGMPVQMTVKSNNLLKPQPSLFDS